jgi:hypothetical protein
MVVYMSKEYLGTKTAMVVAPGMYMKCAERLARDFKRVLYHDPFWRTAFPKFTQAQVGEGLLETEGVEKCNNFWDYIDEVDLFVFPDCGFSDWTEYLKSIGKRVWCSGRAEELELERTEGIDYLEQLGLPVPEYEKVKGLTKLRAYLENKKDVYVKTNVFRGSQETFHWEDTKLSSPIIDRLENELSGLKDTMEFSVFKSIDGIEVAYDSYFCGGKHPKKVPFGLEIKDTGWFAKIKDFNDLPEPVKKLIDTISPTLELNGYCNFISPEMCLNGKEGTIRDFCCRFPSPPSESYYELITNFSEILWAGGNNEFIEPEYAAQFVMALVICSEWAKDHIQAVYFPKEISKNVKLRNYAIVDNCYYVIPNEIDKSDCIGVIVAHGKSLADCAEKLNKIAEQVKGYQIKIPCAVVADMQKEIEKAKDIGIKF